MRYRVTFSNVIAGRVQPSDTIDHEESPRFGFYWWFWKPTYQTNGGKFKKMQVVDVGIIWLCFYIGLIFWPNMSLKNWLCRNNPKL